MITRILATATLFLLAVNAFWNNAFDAGHILNPFGILFLLLTAGTWFGWDLIREAFRSVMGESQIPIIRLSAKIIGGLSGMMRPPSRRRSSAP